MQFPGFVATKMTKLRKTSLFISSPEEYSKASSRVIGFEHSSVPCWSHSLESVLAHAFPDDLVNWYILRFFLNLRRKAQFKESQKTKLQQHNDTINWWICQFIYRSKFMSRCFCVCSWLGNERLSIAHEYKMQVWL